MTHLNLAQLERDCKDANTSTSKDTLELIRRYREIQKGFGSLSEVFIAIRDFLDDDVTCSIHTNGPDSEQISNDFSYADLRDAFRFVKAHLHLRGSEFGITDADVGRIAYHKYVPGLPNNGYEILSIFEDKAVIREVDTEKMFIVYQSGVFVERIGMIALSEWDKPEE